MSKAKPQQHVFLQYLCPPKSQECKALPSNAPELLSNHGNRIVKAKWLSEQQNAFLASLRIIGTDRVGLMRDVTDIISNELKVNMRSISIDTETGIFDGHIRLYINNTSHLDQLIHKLEKVDGVMRVTRFDSSDGDN